MVENLFFMRVSVLMCLMQISMASIGIGYSGNGSPMKYISSCEIDINGDNKPDIALLAETISGVELIILMRNNSGYEAYVEENDAVNMNLKCLFGSQIREKEHFKRDETFRLHKTKGTYIELAQPEGAVKAIFWDGNKFISVWVSD